MIPQAAAIHGRNNNDFHISAQKVCLLSGTDGRARSPLARPRDFYASRAASDPKCPLSQEAWNE